MGFEQSKIDSCIFYHEEIVFVAYVDDCLVCFHTSPKHADDFIAELVLSNFTLTEEGEY
jgi:hypothetical protein